MFSAKRQKSVVTPILILVITSFTLLPVISCAFTYFLFYEKSISALKQENVALIDRIDSWIKAKGDLAQNNALLLSNPDINKEMAIKYFASLFKAADGEVSDIYAGFTDNTGVFSMGWVPPPEWQATQRPWYISAVRNPDKTVYPPPYYDMSLKQLAFAVARAFHHNDVIAGVVAIDIPLTTMEDYIEKVNATSSSKSFLLDANGDILIHPDPAFAPNPDASFKNIKVVENGKYVGMFEQIAKNGIYKGSNIIYIGAPLETTGWFAITDITTLHIVKDAFRTLGGLIVTFIVILLIAIPILLVFIKKRVSVPLGMLSIFMTKASETGDISLTPDDVENINKCTKVNDEIGKCIRSTTTFVEYIVDNSEKLKLIADGDLTVEIEKLSAEDTMGKSLEGMLDSLNSMFGEINNISAQVSNSAKQVAETSSSIASGASQMAEGAQSLAEGASKQAEHIQEVSHSIDDIAEKTKVNVGMADQAAKLADTIINKAKRGNSQMDEMITAVNDITAASKSVSNIMQTINSIASQTNLLSLNAAIEAARAGEHGKGFSVVAEEVRDLANQSAAAAKETSSIVQDSIEKAELGTRIVKEMAASLTEIIAGINESSQLVMEIAQASEEQAKGIAQVNINVSKVADVIQNTSAIAEENAATSEKSATAAKVSAASSEEMSSQASILEKLTAQFKLK